jgi:hypothetical protein
MVGALITVFAVIIDPFAQQLIRYYSCSLVVAGSVASIPTTNFYDGPGGIHDGANSNTVSLNMQAAVNAGIFSPGANRVEANCSSGNCTFPAQYKTIAFCSTCNDITSQLSFNVSSNSSIPIRTNYTLPSGLTLDPSEGPAFIMGPDNQSVAIQAVTSYISPPLNCTAGSEWGCGGVGAVECLLSYV